MHNLIQNHRAQIENLCRQFNVSRLEVFGSAARASDFDVQKSDADFLVEFRHPSKMKALEQYMGFRERLAELLGRPVDLVESGAVRNPYLRKSIDESKELVFAA